MGRGPYKKSEKQRVKEELSEHLGAGRWQWETVEPPEELISQWQTVFDRETIIETAMQWRPPFNSTEYLRPYFPEEAKHLFIDPYQAAVEGGPLGLDKFLQQRARECTALDKRMAKCLIPIIASWNCKSFTPAKAQRDVLAIAGLTPGISDPRERGMITKILSGLTVEGRLTKDGADYTIVPGVGDRLDNIEIPERKSMTREQLEAVRRLLIYNAMSESGKQSFEVWDLRRAAGRNRELFGGRPVNAASAYCYDLVKEGLIKENGASTRYGTVARLYLPTEELLKTKPDTLRAIINAPMRQ